MQELKLFLSAFCVVCVVTGGMSMLIPSGAMERSVRYALALLFLLCVLSSVRLVKHELTLPTAPARQTAETDDAALAELTVRIALRNSGLEFSEITVCTDKNETGGIRINKIIIRSPESPEAIRQVLGGDEAEYETEVIK